MEESAKRRERLKAMRVEASQAGVYNDGESYAGSHGLSNPLIETSPQVESCATPRFDYYTDPLSAFSGNKRSSKVSNQIPPGHFTPPRPRNPEITPSPAHQAQTNYSPDPRMYQTQGPHFSSGPYRSPIGMASPFGAHQGTPPRVWNGSGGSPSYCFPSNSSRGGNFPSPGFVQGGSPSFSSEQGRGHWFSNSPGPGSGYGGSPSPNSGRGRGRWFGSGRSPSSGRSGGRGLGSRDRVSAELRPDLYYNKSMVEDPWKFLKPVIWKRENAAGKSLNTPDSLKSWLPKSISMKKARVSGASNESTSQRTGPSLAEYLAASFNEAVDNEAANDEPTV
uniref:Putative RNA-binding protein FUS isoform X1 n=1 Tax=Davidia involucrata TaxID=16924 RepID=A0A5B6ZIB8_DAVIN